MNSTTACRLPFDTQFEQVNLHKEKILPTRPPPNYLRVLVVDDNKTRANSNMEIISRLGHVVDLALDGFSALRMAAANHPDAVLLSFDLRNLEECDVAKHLRIDFQEQPPLIIGFASHASNSTRLRCVSGGMDMVLEAPLNAEAIATVLLFESARVNVARRLGDIDDFTTAGDSGKAASYSKLTQSN